MGETDEMFLLPPQTLMLRINSLHVFVLLVLFFFLQFPIFHLMDIFHVNTSLPDLPRLLPSFLSPPGNDNMASSTLPHQITLTSFSVDIQLILGHVHIHLLSLFELILFLYSIL